MNTKFTLSIFLLFFSSILFSQNWTWMHGDSVAEKQAVIGTIGVASPSNKPCGVRQAAHWRDSAGNFWFYGGTNNSISMDNVALWKYNITTNQWMIVNKKTPLDFDGFHGIKGVASINNNPGYRRLPVSWVDNNGKFWMFGGSIDIISGEKYRNDMWMYDPTTDMWTWVSGDSTYNNYGSYGTLGVPSATNKPSTRIGACGWKDSTGNLWLYGGQGHNGSFLSDLWKYDITTNMWTWIKGGSSSLPFHGTAGVPTIHTTPGGREGCVSWVDLSGNLWLFGGYGKIPVSTTTTTTNFNSIWKYEIATNLWTWVKGDTSINPGCTYGVMGIPNANNMPFGLNYANGWADPSGNIIIHGGNANTTFSNPGFRPDLWKFDITTNNWTWLKGTPSFGTFAIYGTKGIEAGGNSPGPKAHAMSWTANGYHWYFGGYGASINSFGGHHNAVWRLNMNYSTSVNDDLDNAISFNLFPNPATNIIYINSNQSIENATISVTNTLGQMIHTESFNGTESYISIENFSAGIYYLTIKNNQTSSVIKFIKQ